MSLEEELNARQDLQETRI